MRSNHANGTDLIDDVFCVLVYIQAVCIHLPYSCLTYWFVKEHLQNLPHEIHGIVFQVYNPNDVQNELKWNMITLCILPIGDSFGNDVLLFQVQVIEGSVN